MQTTTEHTAGIKQLKHAADAILIDSVQSAVNVAAALAYYRQESYVVWRYGRHLAIVEGAMDDTYLDAVLPLHPICTVEPSGLLTDAVS